MAKWTGEDVGSVCDAFLNFSVHFSTSLPVSMTESREGGGRFLPYPIVARARVIALVML